MWTHPQQLQAVGVHNVRVVGWQPKGGALHATHTPTPTIKVLQCRHMKVAHDHRSFETVELKCARRRKVAYLDGCGALGVPQLRQLLLQGLPRRSQWGVIIYFTQRLTRYLTLGVLRRTV